MRVGQAAADQGLEQARQERHAAKREAAKASLQKGQVELQLRLADIEGLERRVALLAGDSGVDPPVASMAPPRAEILELVATPADSWLPAERAGPSNVAPAMPRKV